MSFLASLFGSKKEEAKPANTNLNVTNEQLEIMGITRDQYLLEKKKAKALAEARRLNVEARAHAEETRRIIAEHNAAMAPLFRPKPTAANNNAELARLAEELGINLGAGNRPKSPTYDELEAMPKAERNAYYERKLAELTSGGRRKTRRRRATQRKTRRFSRRRAH